MIGWRQRARYRFDNLMARGTIAQVLLLGGLSVLLVLGTAGLIVGLGLDPVAEDGTHEPLLTGLWKSFNHAISGLILCNRNCKGCKREGS